MVLSNGLNRQDELGQSGENYYEMIDKIKKLGPLKSVVKNYDLVMSIIAYNGDRHFFAAFIDIINKALKEQQIDEEDLELFNTGKVADALINIQSTVENYGKRQAYPAEIMDKLAYLSCINDPKAFAASFTHPQIMEGIKNHDRNFTYWMGNYDTPKNGVMAVAAEMIRQGLTEEAANYLQLQSGISQKNNYQNENKVATR